MPKYVIDKSVIDQINRGNYQLAEFLVKLLETRAEVWMTAETYREVTKIDRSLQIGPPTVQSDGSYQMNVYKDRLQNLRNANAQFIREVGIRYPMQDNYVQRYNQKRMLDGFNFMTMTTAALAFHLDAELITMDGEFLTTWRKVQGRVIPQLGGLTPVSGAIDYNRTRRYFNLKPATIAGDNLVVVPDKDPGPPAKLVYADRGPGNPPERIEPPINGPRTAGGARTMDMKKTIRKEVGEPLTAPQEYGPGARGEAGMQGRIIVLQGLNLLFKYLNGRDNQARFEADWKKLAPEVTATLNDDPSLGALILVNYSKAGTAGDGSVIDAPVTYTFTQVSYGRSRFEARQNIPPGYEARPAGSTAEEQWIPPKQPLDITKLPTPFPSLALATFVPGKARFINVGFKYRGGFYEHGGSSNVTAAADPARRPRFLILDPPEKVQVFYFGHWHYIETDVNYLHAAEGESGWDARIGHGVFVGYPNVELNRSTNASMVYPADKSTERLFDTVAKTNDKENLLARYEMKLIRWIEPENIRLLDVFS